MQALFYDCEQIILASGSPRRQLFLKELGLAYTVVRPHGVEPTPQQDEPPAEYARRAASVKAQVVARSHKEAVVLAADTVVALGNAILGKPRDGEDALCMLRMLSGKTPEVITAVSMAFPGGEELLFNDTTEVHFHPWSEKVLATYARCGEPLDKAGAYAIQGQGAFLVQSITGSWSTVVGLPVTQVTDILLSRGVIAVK